jgi:multidrug efflux system outer membrane protein
MNPPALHRPAAALILLCCALLPACKVGPNYERPEVVTPAGFRDGPAQPDAASLADLPWWEVFQDEVLQGLIHEALANNFDARIAITRIEQARAIEMQTASPLYPQIGYQGAISPGRNSFLGNASPNGGDTSTSALLTLNAFWEIDLWGRIRRADEAAIAEILASEEARRGILLTLLTSVAQAYFELLELDLEVEIANRNLFSFQESLDLFSRRSSGGVDSRLQVFRAQANLAQVAASIPELERLIAIKENEISLLLGRAPGPIDRGDALLAQQMPVEIPVGLPSDLLERRPDIRQAEQQLIAANARIGVAHAGYFPRLGLTAFFGQASSTLGDFTSGTSTAWALAGNLAGPIFTGGLTKGQVDQAIAAREEARLRYEQSIMIALGEVANTLTTRQKLVGVAEQLGLQVNALSSAVDMSRERFDVGRASYFEILDAQQQLFPAETALARTRASEYIAIIQLYKTLGGGWNIPAPLPSDTPESESPEAAPESGPPPDTQAAAGP